jgi:hypothetical protein
VAIDDLLRHDVIPLLFVYLAVLAMLGYCARVLHARSRNGFAIGSVGARTQRGWVPLLRHIAITAVCGYALFLAVVGLLYGLVAEVTFEFLRDAVVGGGFLAFVVALPVFVALSWVGSARMR